MVFWDEVFYDQRQLGLCIFSYMTVQLLAGDLYVVGSYEYANPMSPLLSWKECLERLPAYCERLELPTTAREFVQHLANWLDQTAQETAAAFPTTGQVYFNNGQPILRQLPRNETPVGAKS
jgi:hypothetical protein